MRLDAKRALVTGSSRGIGRAIAVSLAKAGAEVLINYCSNETAAFETARLIQDLGALKPKVLQFDVSNSRQVQEKLEGVEVDILVNNAGITRDALLLRLKDADVEAVLATNVAGALYCARVCARHMVRQRWGRIINISSIP